MTELTLRTDQELVDIASQAPEGDMRAFESLVRRYRSRITANCRYVTGMADDAEDLAQEVFLKVFFAMDRFEGRSSFRTWLQRIKVNHCLNHLKKERNVSRIDFDDVEDRHEQLQVPAEAQRHLERAGDRQMIEDALEGMSDTLRIPLILRDMDQLAYDEIAEALGVGLSAVKMRIKRARAEFRRRYPQPGKVPVPEAKP